MEVAALERGVTSPPWESLTKETSYLSETSWWPCLAAGEWIRSVKYPELQWYYFSMKGVLLGISEKSEDPLLFLKRRSFWNAEAITGNIWIATLWGPPPSQHQCRSLWAPEDSHRSLVGVAWWFGAGLHSRDFARLAQDAVPVCSVETHQPWLSRILCNN